ncbi:hypothetical protein J4Q44_G00069410 [Coregonus suidteri]|uniref:Uncharacterized protein n=1 Tax=Coregonus suidteri TaxID=861788 RepID=A0AAN8M4U0_9TELE
MGIGAETNPPTTAHSVVMWLGYFNSTVNPILYPALNRDFCKAHWELLRCRGPRWRHVHNYLFLTQWHYFTDTNKGHIPPPPPQE